MIVTSAIARHLRKYWLSKFALPMGLHVLPLAEITKGVARPLGTSFAVARLDHERSLWATALHVTGRNDRDLRILYPVVQDVSAYQDTSAPRVRTVNVSMIAADTFHDIAILEADFSWQEDRVPLPLEALDATRVGEDVDVVGYPHAPDGRRIVTIQRTQVGAKVILSTASGVKSKHCVINLFARPGQSGSPIISRRSGAIVAMLIGAHSTDHSGFVFGPINPGELHQTTHAVSAAYIRSMLEGHHEQSTGRHR